MTVVVLFQISMTIIDGERCGETLKSIFENAKNPERITVGLVEQNEPSDKFCLESYCASYGKQFTMGISCADLYVGLDILDRKVIRNDFVKVFLKEEMAKCPHANQINPVNFFYVNAKGPIKARSIARKALGNEEFCLQIDAHTEFVPEWDEVVKEDWEKTDNEFAVLSAVPPPVSEKGAYSLGGDKHGRVPRQCKIRYRDNKFPDYESPADGYAEGLDRPLLSHGYSGAFAFSKCHLEESAPHDPFLEFAMPIEQFSRYARFWTRGYDTYTPTQNVVFHNYDDQENGHGGNEWFKRQKDRFRKASILRVKTALQLPEGDSSPAAQSNLGIYGIGRRRSLEQLSEFTNLDLKSLRGNTLESLTCSGKGWVSYDEGISPVQNLFDNPDNLDPQPEFPRRSKLVFYKQDIQALPDIDVDVGISSDLDAPVEADQYLQNGGTSFPSFLLLFTLWIFGLLVWCTMFVLKNASAGRKPRSKKAKLKQSKEV